MDEWGWWLAEWLTGGSCVRKGGLPLRSINWDHHHHHHLHTRTRSVHPFIFIKDERRSSSPPPPLLCSCVQEPIALSICCCALCTRCPPVERASERASESPHNHQSVEPALAQLDLMSFSHSLCLFCFLLCLFPPLVLTHGSVSKLLSILPQSINHHSFIHSLLLDFLMLVSNLLVNVTLAWRMNKRVRASQSPLCCCVFSCLINWAVICCAHCCRFCANALTFTRVSWPADR